MHFLIIMNDKIELLVPAGSMANLKAAVSRGADAVYLGMQRFNAREFATNFNEKYLKEAIKICKSNDVKAYLTMNTLVKNSELSQFFEQLSFAYEQGIDAVILQEISFIDIVKKHFPDLRIHISTQAGVMNSAHAGLLSAADRINLARELTKEEVRRIRSGFKKELEIFCHGALCASISGSCLFSSLLGGRSGNRGKCAQPCRRKYDNEYLLSAKELCLIERIPEIIRMGINSIKIEGRMRTPYYVATVTDIYRKAIDSFYKGSFDVPKEAIKKLSSAFSRGFTEGRFSSKDADIFNTATSSGESNIGKETYKVRTKNVDARRKRVKVILPKMIQKAGGEKRILARAYTKKDAVEASESGADVIYFDLFDKDFSEVKAGIKCKLFGITPRIMLDSDILEIMKAIKEKNPDGIFAGNLGMLNLGLKIPIHLDYSSNCFNELGLDYFSKHGALPVISPELSVNEMKDFSNKNFASFVHGKIRLMTLRHPLDKGWITDEKGIMFRVGRIRNGSEIINEKELGLLGKSSQLLNAGVTNFFIDTEMNVGEIVKLYKKMLNRERINDSGMKKNYVLGWSFRGVY